MYIKKWPNKILITSEAGFKRFKHDATEYVEANDVICEPIKSTNLVDRIHIYKSFMDCEIGEYLKAKMGGEEFLMKYYGIGWRKDTFVAQRVGGSCDVIEFHANGVECTHRKNKIVLNMCTPEEVEEIKRCMTTKPFVEALELLTNNIPGVTLDKSKIVLPEWMDEHKAVEFYEMVDDFIANAV